MNATISAFSFCSEEFDTHGAALLCADGPHPQIVIGHRVLMSSGVVSGDETFDTAVTGMALRALRFNFKAAFSCSLLSSTNGAFCELGCRELEEDDEKWGLV